jgi:hypothetical protein
MNTLRKKRSNKQKKTKKNTRNGGGMNPFQICSDTNECISFGLENHKIREYFFGGNYVSGVETENRIQKYYYGVSPTLGLQNFFNFADTTNIQRIGEPSRNGFISNIPFVKNNYTLNALIKSSRDSKADNLLYEGYVGCAINSLSIFVPCFVETYAIGKYPSNDNILYNSLLNDRYVTQQQLNTLSLISSDNLINMSMGVTERRSKQKLTPMELLIRDSCKNPTEFCIMIEHLKNSKTLKDCATDVELISHMFQIYFVLDTLKYDFTHYDLHPKNVLVYSPSPSQSAYVTMIYNYNDGSRVEFKTFGIMKLIDYGHSFVYASKSFTNLVCNSELCQPNCGINSGYVGKNIAYKKDYINSYGSNVSHDLRLLNFYKNSKNRQIFKIANKVTYLGEYGTPENKTKGYTFSPSQIFNVTDAHLLLKKILKKGQDDSIYNGKPCLGTLEIWEDKQTKMIYTPTIPATPESLPSSTTWGNFFGLNKNKETALQQNTNPEPTTPYEINNSQPTWGDFFGLTKKNIPESFKPETFKPETFKPESYKPESYKPESYNSETYRYEPSVILPPLR